MALVCHRRKAICLHNHKTAGTALRSVLQPMGFRVTWEDPLWSSEVNQHLTEVPEEFCDYHVFSVWRNPFDRTVSLWKYKIQKQDYPKISLEEFCEAEYEEYQQAPFLRASNQVIDFSGMRDGFEVDRVGRIELRRVENASVHKPWRVYFNGPAVGAVLKFFSDDFDVIEERTGENLRESWREAA